MTLDFNKFAQEGNQFINALAEDLGRSRQDTALLLRSTLHALRDRISPEESIHLVSQLPFFLKAVYVDSWSLSDEVTRTKSFDEFIVLVMTTGEQTSGTELGNEGEVKKGVRTVFNHLNKYVSEGEWKHVSANLPEEMQEVVLQAVG